jgi:hypothetical protein
MGIDKTERIWYNIYTVEGENRTKRIGRLNSPLDKSLGLWYNIYVKRAREYQA